MVKLTAKHYLDVKQTTTVFPAAGREVESVGPCCLDVNTKAAFIAKGREGGVWAGIWFTIAFAITPMGYWLFAGEPLLGAGMGLLIAGGFSPVILGFIYSWRNEVPMRFNRNTRKVYFQHRGRLYTSDWDSIRAYLKVQHGVVYGGGRVRDPQVNIEFEGQRGKSGTVLLMATGSLTLPEQTAAASLWEYIRLYMEEGPEILPKPKIQRRYDALAQMRRDLNPFPIRSNPHRLWLTELLILFPVRVLWFSVTYPTEIIYRSIADRLKLVTPLLPEMEEAGRCTESEESRRKRLANLLRDYDQQLHQAEHRLEALERSLLFQYDLQFVNPRHPTPRFVDGIPEGWFRVPLSDLVEFNPWHRLKAGRQIRYLPLDAVPENGMLFDREKLEWRGNQNGPTFRNGDVLIPAVSGSLEDGRVGLVDFLKGYDLPPSDKTFLQRLDGYEVGVGSADFIVMRGTSVSPGFAYCIAKDPRLQEYARTRLEADSGTARLPTSALAEFELPMPPPSLLKTFEDYTAKPFLRNILQLAAERERLLFLRGQLIKNCPWLVEAPVKTSFS